MNSSFSGWPSKTLLESGNIPYEQLARLALREGQSSNPLYRVHRWFARRVGSQFRSIITALSLTSKEEDLFWDKYLSPFSINDAIVLDPFSGGGTTLIESLHCNARVIGFDIDPVATFISKFEISATNMQESYPEIDEINSRLSKKIKKYHKTTIKGVEYDVLHHFWVQEYLCDNCGATIELHPHYQLSYDKLKKIQIVFCQGCLKIHEIPISQERLKCECGIDTEINIGITKNGKYLCPNCKSTGNIVNNELKHIQPPKYKLFAQEYIEYGERYPIRHFKSVDSTDFQIYQQSSKLLHTEEQKKGIIAPIREIPREGRQDGRPIIHGIKKYRDFFNDRQLLHLSLLGKEIKSIHNLQAKYLMAMAYSDHLTTNCLYTGYAFGYRRTSPLFSIHSYRHITRPIEINPWLFQIGRGTFLNAINKVKKAIKFSKNPYILYPDGGRITIPISHKIAPIGSINQVLLGDAKAAIITHSSEKLSEIPSKCIDLVLTDPPYFNNINYSELSDFYLAWHQALGIAEYPYNDVNVSAPILSNYAVSKNIAGVAFRFQRNLEAVFSECYRVLNDNGLCAFTYHHNSPEAWSTIGASIINSGFKISKVLPMRSEGQNGMHSYEGTIKWDALLVCRKDLNFKKSKNGELFVQKSEIEEIDNITDYYITRFSNDPTIGFRKPDQINFKRALMVANASFKRGKNSVLLFDALNRVNS